MKKLLLLLTLLPLTIFAQTEQQGSESVSEWTSIQYVDLDNDIISSSNLSFGFLGQFSIFTYNIAYQFKNKNHTNGLFLSRTPSFNFTKFGYNYIREKEFPNGLIRTNTYSLTIGGSDVGVNTISVTPFFNQTYQKNTYKLGYTLFVKDNSWDGFELLDTYIPAGFQTKFSAMLLGMKEFQVQRWVVRPEIFMLSSLRTHFKHLEDSEDYLDIWFWNRTNLTTYFGTTIQYNVTDVFAFATKFRSSYTYDISDIENGYSKTTPYIFSIGANYDF